MSSEDLVIDVRGLSKRYEIYAIPRDRLKQFVLPPLHGIAARAFSALGGSGERPAPRYFREFWALREVSFQMRRGETLGVIGRNGSGKSTLLHLICGTLTPTSGEVRVKGRISALLELGSGFNPEYSGRDNIFLSGQVVGMSRAEIESRYEAIVDFADIGDFIDQPVKTYSSGMVVRLAFATQTALDPDVLIVDEALAVGDMSFQIKCFSRMNQLRERGVTILFVTHSLGGMISFCDRGLYLRQGAQAALGPAADVARQYEQEILAEKMTPPPQPAAVASPAPLAGNGVADEARALSGAAMQFRPRFLEYAAAGSREGSKAAIIESFALLGEDGAPHEAVSPEEAVTGCFVIRFNTDFAGEVHLSIQVIDRYGSPVMVIRDSRFEEPVTAAAGSLWQGVMRFALPLQAGVYYCRLGVLLFQPGEKYRGGQFNFDKAQIADLIEHGAHFTVHPMPRHPIPAPVLQESALVFRYLGEEAP